MVKQNLYFILRTLYRGGKAALEEELKKKAQEEIKKAQEEMRLKWEKWKEGGMSEAMKQEGRRLLMEYNRLRNNYWCYVAPFPMGRLGPWLLARGFLGMEIPVEKIFLAQKTMIYRCNLAGKPVVTATQMLESMIKSPRPIRAEATEVANAVLEAESYSPYESARESCIFCYCSPYSRWNQSQIGCQEQAAVPILSVVVPVLTTDSFDWTCSNETPARHSLVYRCLIDTKGPEIRTGLLKDVNLPGVVVDLPTLTEKVKQDILEWGVPDNIDMIALSFFRNGPDLVNVRKVLGPENKHIQLINFYEISRETDSFMVARGDRGMEIPVEKIFLSQKMMIYKCVLAGKPVVAATQMLESMIKSPRPTRAEATDVANAVLDGTDCVMLSGESAAGAYPELAVKIMAHICIEAESSLDYGAIFKEMIRGTPLPMSPLESLASSAVGTANKARAKLIVVLTRGGTTAKLVAKYRPSVPILSVVVPVLTTDSFDWTCSDETPARHSLVYRGLIPVLAEGSAKATDSESTEVILEAALKQATQKGLCKPGDSIVALHRIGAASVIKICIVK